MIFNRTCLPVMIVVKTLYLITAFCLCFSQTCVTVMPLLLKCVWKRYCKFANCICICKCKLLLSCRGVHKTNRLMKLFFDLWNTSFCFMRETKLCEVRAFLSGYASLVKNTNASGNWKKTHSFPNSLFFCCCGFLVWVFFFSLPWYWHFNLC